MTSLANALDPSSRAAAADGPKHEMPATRTSSAMPATRGASGPITTRSLRSRAARPATAAPDIGSAPACSATAAVPALPGAHANAVTFGSDASARHNACSRAPEPTTRTRTDGSVRYGRLLLSRNDHESGERRHEHSVAG